MRCIFVMWQFIIILESVMFTIRIVRIHTYKQFVCACVKSIVYICKDNERAFIWKHRCEAQPMAFSGNQSSQLNLQPLCLFPMMNLSWKPFCFHFRERSRETERNQLAAYLFISFFVHRQYLFKLIVIRDCSDLTTLSFSTRTQFALIWFSIKFTSKHIDIKCLRFIFWPFFKK